MPHARAIEQQEPGGLAATASAVPAVLVDSTALALLLPAGSDPPTVGRIGASAHWHALCWDGGGVALVHDETLALGRLQGSVVKAGEAGDGRSWLFPDPGAIAVDAELLAQHVRATGGDPRAVFDFLVDALPMPNPRQVAFLQAFLEACASRDGFIEIVAAPEGRGVLIQGWGQNLPSGVVRVGIVAEQLGVVEVAVASFDRPDLLAPARGFVAFALELDQKLADRIRFACFEAGARLLRLDVVTSGKLVLQGPPAIAHLADMLPRLTADAAVLQMFRRVCRPRFGGADTLGDWPQPVRAAVDLLLDAGGKGLLVTGWLLDPQARVRIALLKSTGGFYVRLERSWVRLPRPDLNEGFAGHPLFAEHLRPEDTSHGFICYAPARKPLAPDDRYYLELVFEDERCAFVPLEAPVDPIRAHQHLPRLLGGIALDEPELVRIVRDHLAPFVMNAAGARPEPAAMGAPISLGEPRSSSPAVSAVIPIGEDWTAVEALLACLSGDPDFRNVELVLVASPAAARRIGARLADTLRFYRLAGQLVIAPASADIGEAIDIGARVASGDALLCMHPAVLPQGHGWLSRLVTELARRSETGLVCPTLLYEDRSIRFAGDHGMPDTDGEQASRFAGYPSHWLVDGPPAPTSHGPAECFVVPRDTFLSLGGLGGSLLGPELRHLDLAARIRAAGRTCLWVPNVALWALDEPEPSDEHWRRIARLVDRAAFARRWPASPAVAPTDAGPARSTAVENAA